jgi:uncharacterized membrane protein
MTTDHETFSTTGLTPEMLDQRRRWFADVIAKRITIEEARRLARKQRRAGTVLPEEVDDGHR